MAEDVIKCRLQFINDLDPFVSTADRQPMIPFQAMLILHEPIGAQLPDLIRRLKAPHKARQNFDRMKLEIASFLHSRSPCAIF